jgi:hypothetical protein
MFIEAVDTSNEVKSAEYMAKQIDAVIERHNIAVEDIVHRLNDLVFMHYNLRFLQRKNTPSTKPGCFCSLGS